LKSTATDTDLQVTISEVRPDGSEMFVQAGWLRASHRKLGPKSTATDPRPTHVESDAAPLPSGTFTLVRVPIFPFGQTFRAGTRLRVSIQAPGGDKQIWRFATIETGSTVNEIGIGGDHASAVVLPVVPSVASGPEPPCPSNRAQPCRTYVAAANGG
jgi:predicted acyl esterase